MSDEDHALVAERAARAGMKKPAYLRRIACGVLPAPKTKNFVTHGMALAASELDAAAKEAKEETSKQVLLAARDRLRSLLKQHLSEEQENDDA